MRRRDGENHREKEIEDKEKVKRKEKEGCDTYMLVPFVMIKRRGLK